MVAEYPETSDYFYFENQYNSSDGDGETAICKICGDVTYFTGDSPSEQSNLDDHLRTHGLDFAPDLNKWINVESYANEGSDCIMGGKHEPITGLGQSYPYESCTKCGDSIQNINGEWTTISVAERQNHADMMGQKDWQRQLDLLHESKANEDSLVKIEDDDDKDTKVTVLDEWENETDPDVGGDVEGLDQSELEEVDYNNIGESRTFRSKYECEHCNCGFKSNESLSLHYNDIHALPPTHIEGYENWKDVAVGLMKEQSKKYQSKKKKGSESELEDARSNMSFWKNELEGLGDYIGHDEELAKTLGAPYQNDGESYNPDEFVCPECGFKSIDQKEFDDHLSAHSFEIGDF